MGTGIESTPGWVTAPLLSAHSSLSAFVPHWQCIFSPVKVCSIMGILTRWTCAYRLNTVWSLDGVLCTSCAGGMQEHPFYCWFWRLLWQSNVDKAGRWFRNSFMCSCFVSRVTFQHQDAGVKRDFPGLWRFPSGHSRGCSCVKQTNNLITFSSQTVCLMNVKKWNISIIFSIPSFIWHYLLVSQTWEKEEMEVSKSSSVFSS